MRYLITILLVLAVGICSGEDKAGKPEKKLSALGTVVFSSGTKYPQTRVVFDSEEISVMVAGEEKAKVVKVREITVFKQSVAEEKYETIKVGKKRQKKPIRSFKVEITTAGKKVVAGKLSSPLTITVITGAAALTGTMKKIESGKVFDYWELEHTPEHSGREISHKDMDVLRQKIKAAQAKATLGKKYTLKAVREGKLGQRLRHLSYIASMDFTSKAGSKEKKNTKKKAEK